MSMELTIPAAPDGGTSHQSTDGVPPPRKRRRRRRKSFVPTNDDLLAYLVNQLKSMELGLKDPGEANAARAIVETILKYRADASHRGPAQGPLDLDQLREFLRTHPLLLDQLEPLFSDEQLDELLGE